MDAKAKAGDQHARTVRRWVLAALAELQSLTAAPQRSDETASLKWVRQSHRYPVWRTSHPFVAGVAVRVICYFPPEQPDTVVVALFAADKATMGDVFYDSVGARADASIDRWYRQMKDKP
ncbi:MAG: hypothetical protein BGO26_12925 [Actinobacteria bacterium 69-20]|nr:MAG: hypothetical protein BGO26_12925 [Actinobacteria bacterium 69-20]